MFNIVFVNNLLFSILKALHLTVLSKPHQCQRFGKGPSVLLSELLPLQRNPTAYKKGLSLAGLITMSGFLRVQIYRSNDRLGLKTKTTINPLSVQNIV